MPDRSDKWFQNWFEQKTIVPHKKLLWFCLGFIAVFLPLVVGYLTLRGAAVAFLIPFFLLLLILFLVSPIPYREISYDNSRWGIFSIIVLGVGFGALTYRYQRGFVWLWYQFLRLNEPYKWVLVSLFLTGVVLGFFVVRNWSKSQQEFVSSLTAVVAVSFVSTLLGQLGNGNPKLDSVTTFAYYALGFVLSGAINLIVSSLLIAHYSRTQSITTKSVIDFLYGSEIAKKIDGYFLVNYEEDPNYAAAKLRAALKTYTEIIRVEFAKKMTRRKQTWQEPPRVTSPPLSPPVFGCSPTPPLDYFELLAITSHQPVTSPPVSPPTPAPGDIFEVVFRKLRKDEPIDPEMFRVAISYKWLDNLEYLVPPGLYQKSFPYFGSVAGLALAVRQTIVMDRDRYKKFRSQDFVDGRSPNEVDQRRGLHKIDYLSYIAIPMASNFGRQEEIGLGVLHVDTKLFACASGYLEDISTKVSGADPTQEVYKLTRTRKELDDFATFASNLYEEDDEYIKSLEHFRDVVIPLLELYLKCRVGTP